MSERMYVMPVPRKDPVLSLLASVFVPGLGSLLNGNVPVGLCIMFGHFACTVILVLTWWLLLPLVLIPLAFGLWVWGMVDAYSGAKAWNMARGLR